MVMTETPIRIDPKRAAPVYDTRSLINPDVLASEMISAGFHDVTIERLEHVSVFSSAEVLWSSLVAGSVPITTVKLRMPEEIWHAKSEEAFHFLRSKAGPFPARLGTTA